MDDWINEYFYLNTTQAEHNANLALLDQIQNGEDGDVLARQDNESVTRGSLRTLDPGTWLNDEIIAFYLKHCLANRDERKCLHESRERRQAFFSSYFFDHLYDNLDKNQRRRRRYNYNGVDGWGNRVPGQNIFNLKRLFIPINEGNVHWTLAVINMETKRIEYYDSL